MKSGIDRSLDVGKRVVLVAVKASRDISTSAFIWALTHVVQPGDYVKLLVLIPAHSSSKLFSFCPNIHLHITTTCIDICIYMTGNLEDYPVFKGGARK